VELSRFGARPRPVRARSATETLVTQALAATSKRVPGVDVQLQRQVQPTFMKNLDDKPTQISFGWIRYGMDYLDAINMLGVFKSGGRHSWKSEQVDKLITDGGKLTGNPRRRPRW
jgi:hypothetical protein